MSKVIDTDCMGAQLTGRVFARNLEPGDLLVSGTGRVIEVLGQEERLVDGFCTIRMRSKALSVANEFGAYRIPYGINQSVDRIVGARSAGQIN